MLLFNRWRAKRVDALLVTTDPVFESQRDRIVALAATTPYRQSMLCASMPWRVAS